MIFMALHAPVFHLCCLSMHRYSGLERDLAMSEERSQVTRPLQFLSRNAAESLNFT